MSSVIAETIESIKEKSPAPLQEIWVDDLVLGIFFTGVKLSTGHGGCAFTPIGDIPEAVCCPTTAARMPPAGSLDRKPVSEIIHYSLDPNVLKSAIGIAALNGLSQWIIESGNEWEYEVVKGEDGFDLLNIQPHETVSLVGAFGPYIKRLKAMGNPFYIIEKNRQTLRPDEMKHFKPESEMNTAIEKSQVVIITGTAIVNHTIDATLSWVDNGKRTAIIGPTASLIPDAFFRRGVNVMAGVRILNPDQMLKILKQGGSAYHLLKECSQKIAFVK
ncbi:MAG: Fis family transcriptional regulator [Deltaproteobacteria bacterium]|nr:Fis family transcriptional regulator [Deltaproteobacteria bacterium]